MTKIFRKPVWLFSLLLMVMLFLYGCAQDAASERTNLIPSDGVISEAVFKNMMAEKEIGVFNGSGNDITYQWLFLGSEIEEPKSENLLLVFSNAKTDSVKRQLDTEFIQEFSFTSKELIGGSPSLSLYFPIRWNVEAAEVYKLNEENGTAELVTDAVLENSPNAIVTFSPKEVKGLFYIVGRDKNEAPKEDSTTAEARETKESVVSEKAGQGLSDDYLTPGKVGTEERSDSLNTLPAGEVQQNNEKDKYLTDPIISGKPKPVEPDEAQVDKGVKYTCSLSIRCDTILDNLQRLKPDKLGVVPQDGIILNTKTITFYEGESVFDVLKRETRNSKIHMEMQFFPVYNSAYIEGIQNLYEFDCGDLSGWMYKVNGWFPNYGCSRYLLQDGDEVEWVYTCDLGRDVGGYVDGVENMP